MFSQYLNTTSITINSIIEIYIIYSVFFSRMYALKSNRYIKYIKYLLPLLTIAFRIGFYLITRNIVINIIMSILLFFIILQVLFDKSIYEKLLKAIALVIFMLLTEIVVQIVFMLFNVNPLFISQTVFMLIHTTMSKTLLFWMCVIGSNVVTKKYRSLPMRYWIIIITIPVISIIMLNTVTWSLIFFADKYLIYLTITIAGLMYMNYSVFAFIDSYTTNVKLSVLESLIEKENENYKQLGVSYDQLNKIRHDIKNHIALIKSFMINNDVDMLTKYITDMEYDVNEATVIYTKNSVIDAIINIKGVVAKQNDIRYVVKTNNIIENIYISPYNISRVLGNAIDNAIEACMRIEDKTLNKFIFISFQKIDNKIVISVENSADRVKLSIHNQYESLKEQKGIHGLGLKIIADTVKELDGIMDINYSNNVFTLHVILPNIETQGNNK